MTKKVKAGLIPFYFDKSIGKFKYLMMVSSDAAYGGDKPMISKGGQDPGESNRATALREAEEELGLVLSNLQGCFDVGKSSSKSYKLFVFAGEILDISNFTKPCYETEYTLWMTAEEFYEKGREDHHCFVKQLEGILHNT